MVHALTTLPTTGDVTRPIASRDVRVSVKVTEQMDVRFDDVVEATRR
ncbi:MAG: hypothetical protein WD360_07720 [Nitriliruptoraceae bacterium]